MIRSFILAITCTVISVSALAEKTVEKTRYGTFEIKENPKTLSEAAYFNNKIIIPVIEGNNSLRLVGKYQLDEIDVILVQDNGGVACPAELYFIKLIKGRNPVVSPRFGSCSDLVDIFVKTDRIIVKMPMFAGIAEDPVRLKKIGNKKMIYEYDGNVLKENGKVLKSNNE